MCDFLSNIFYKYINCILCIDIEKDIEEGVYHNYTKRNIIEEDYVIIEKIN